MKKKSKEGLSWLVLVQALFAGMNDSFDLVPYEEK